MVFLQERKLPSGIGRAVALLILNLIYLVLVVITFIANIDLAADGNMQYILHITVILSAFAYLLFVEMVYRTENDIINGRLSLIFSSLFTIPVLLGRGIGILVISHNELNTVNNILNFYGNISISRTIEMISWTTLFPLSVLFLARIFYKNKGRIGTILGGLCLLSSICCFIAFMSIISSSSIYVWIGVLGWGGLFLLIIILYIYRQVKKYRKGWLRDGHIGQRLYIFHCSKLLLLVRRYMQIWSIIY